MKNIEKQLIKSAKLLPKMEKDIVFPNDNISKISYKKITRLVMAPILVLVICFTTTLVVSAQIRESVFMFIKSGIAEIIPSFNNEKLQNDDSMSILVKSNEIRDIADIYYYDLKNHKTDDNGIIEGNKNSKYYYLNRGYLREINKVETFEDTLIIKGNKTSIKFDIVDFGNKKLIYNNIDMNNDISAFAIKTYDSKNVWIQIVDRTQLRRQIDYLLYNVETGEVNDIFSKLLPKNFEIENVIFDERGKHIIIQEFNGGSEQGLYYLLNIKGGKIVKLEELTDINMLHTCRFIDDELLFITAASTKEIDKEKLNAYIYNISSGKVTQIYDETDKFIFSNGKITIIQKEDYYQIIHYTGEIYRLENVNLDGLTFLSNTEGTKIAVLNSNKSVISSLNISELGVIDIKTKTFKIFEREVAENSLEYSVSWDITDNLIITANNMLYQYVFK